MNKLLQPLCIAALLPLLGGCVLAAQLGLTSLTETIYDRRGVQTGQPAPNPLVYGSSGGRQSLSQLWRDKPLLIVNGSYTCPVARLNNPGLGELQDRYRGELRVIVLYVYEPHPKGDPSPYTGEEWVTLSNMLAGILHRQPRSLVERLILARQFERHIQGAVPVLVDDMDNPYWMAVGGGPNTALFIGTNGHVLAKQGWYHQQKMQQVLDRYFGLIAEPATVPASLRRQGPRA